MANMKWSRTKHARGILAREKGTVVKDWGGKLPIALVYPNTYRVGMSSLGFHTIYRLFNARAYPVGGGLGDKDDVVGNEHHARLFICEIESRAEQRIVYASAIALHMGIAK